MEKIVSTRNLGREEWLKYRKGGIGGSDAGAVCGLNPYRTAMQVYRDKIFDGTDGTDNEAMRQGRDLEDYVARRFMESSGKKVRRANAMFRDERNPFMIADVDRMVVGENAGLECKTASPYMEDKWGDGKIPLSYQIQCHHYMSVCNADAWYIAVLIYGRDFKFHRIERDDGIIGDLVRIEQDFWQEHVLKRKMPEPDGSKLADSVIADYYRKSKSLTIPLTGFDGKIKRRQELKGMIEQMETEKRLIEQELKLYLGDAEEAGNGQFKVTWKSILSNRVDEKRLKAEKPEVYREFLKESVSRRLVIKAA